ncbi:TPA: hypothetical protein PXM28_003768 [Yersinia enterocolitica]|nr:hypothetical protein [Yersinia enterocolitica]
MLKKINLSCPLTSVDGVLVKQGMLDLNDQIELIKQRTMNEAENILQLARQDAIHIAQQGYIDGYQKGVLSALTHTAFYFSNCSNYIINTRNAFIKEIRDILSTAVEKPEVLLSVLDEWVKSVPLSENILQINLPEISKNLEPKLNELLTNLWSGPINYTYHADNNYVMSCGQQVAEFSPEIFVGQVVEELMDKFNLIPTDLQYITINSLDLLIKYSESMRDEITKK